MAQQAAAVTTDRAERDVALARAIRAERECELNAADKKVADAAVTFIQALAARQRLYRRHEAEYSEHRMARLFHDLRVARDPMTKQMCGDVLTFVTTHQEER